MEKLVYIACHKNYKIWKKSSSGGAFTAITDAWFNKYGDKAVVYGCILDEDFKAVHVRADSLEQRNKMRGSKYVQSDMSDVFYSVINDLKCDKYVVFSGTPCQVSSLKKYLKFKNIDIENRLLTIDFICHGVGNENFFRDYIKNLENKYKSKAIYCNFRTKSRPGKIQDIEVGFENLKKYNAASTNYDWFYSLYFKGLILRPSCFKCPFATKERESDICIADFRSIENSQLTKAQSLIIISTENGKEFSKLFLDYMDFREGNVNEIHQEHFEKPASKPLCYDEFVNIYKSKGYLEAQRFAGNNTTIGKIRSCIVILLNKFHLIEILKYIKSLFNKW